MTPTEPNPENQPETETYYDPVSGAGGFLAVPQPLWFTPQHILDKILEQEPIDILVANPPFGKIGVSR